MAYGHRQDAVAEVACAAARLGWVQPPGADVDPSGGRRQTFTEDRAVCCRPNGIALVIDEDGEPAVEVIQEYEASRTLRARARALPPGREG